MPHLMMLGNPVFRWASFAMAKIGQQALDRAGVSIDDLDVFVPHQANMRIIDAMARSMKLPERVRIARDIAERHGGEMWAESTPAFATYNFVELPLQPPSSRPSVLLVSDDSRWLREVSRTLRSACDVRTMTAAAAKLGSKHTDLVLLDPDQKPRKRLQALRSEAKGAQVPVIELPSQMAASRLARTLAHLAV